MSLESGEKYIADSGVGLTSIGKMQLFPLSSFDMYDLDHFPSAGQAALKQVHMAQTMRAKEKTMDELKSILQRISFTFDTLKEAEEEIVASLSPENHHEMHMQAKAMRRERIRKKIMKRRRRQKEQKKAKKALLSEQSGDKGTNQTSESNRDVEDTVNQAGGTKMKKDENGDLMTTTDIVVSSDEDDWKSLASDDLDQCASSEFSDISSDEDDLQPLQPKS